MLHTNLRITNLYRKLVKVINLYSLGHYDCVSVSVTSKFFISGRASPPLIKVLSKMTRDVRKKAKVEVEG